MIGHTIGFDLAVLERECRRAGIAWSTPRRLDVRLLAEIVQPSLPDYSLDTIAAWLGIETRSRHSAYGDAVAALASSRRLCRDLRDWKIRTLAEAERASRAADSKGPTSCRRRRSAEPDRGGRKGAAADAASGSTAAPMCDASAR